ncbi:tRNA epoxyqueuosine(34) reductase QueG [Rhodospirillaceae bacterium SYSU D60014]|uniref:tRNA epoxyqueuosine(34) reductase QueG n=1 Tax=Virgifigura deserti TaxID=2268457 RepID=UPI000E65FE7A
MQGAKETDPAAIKDAIRAKAIELGFGTVGFATAKADTSTKQHLADFLAEGQQGDMGWMQETFERRADPRTLWPEARSIVALGMNYGPGHDPLALLDRPDRGIVSVYAQGKDYHDVVKSRLKQLGGWIHRSYGCELKVFVDTAPVMEKPAAEKAGIGWQGKHTNLVSRRFGSWLFLGEIFTTLDLPPDESETDHCGACRRCLDACPTKAFPAPYRLDARRCISYLTIEHKGPIPRAFRRAMGNRIYGCDDCLAVCPWNKFASRTAEFAFQPRAELTAPRLADLADLDDSAFRALFSGSPIKRVGRDRFVRNVLVALGNSSDSGQAERIEALLDDAAPLVRGAAVWALAQLADPARFEELRAHHLRNEADSEVRQEWQAN